MTPAAHSPERMWAGHNLGLYARLHADNGLDIMPLRLSSPFWEVKSGDLKRDVQLIWIGRAWFNVHATNS